MFAFVLDKKITNKKRKADSLDHMSLCGKMKEDHNILMFPSFANDAIRIVTHRDVNHDDMEHLRDCLRDTLQPYL
jgi:hypothetical protein